MNLIIKTMVSLLMCFLIVGCEDQIAYQKAIAALKANQAGQEPKVRKPIVENSTGLPLNASGFEIKDSEFRNAIRPAWVDNDRLLFVGIIPRDPATLKKDAKEQWAYKHQLYLWDTKSNSISLYDKSIDDKVGNICTRNGYIHYWSIDKVAMPDGTIKRMIRTKAGEFGKEKIIGESGADDPPTEAEKYTKVNKFSCREYRTDKFKAKRESGVGNIVLLGEEHGYLIYGEAKTDPIKLFRKHDNQTVLLPIEGGEAEPTQYSTFDNRYLLEGMDAKGHYNRQWPEGTPKPVWLMTPEGEVTEMKIPYGGWFGTGLYNLFHTRAGVFFESRQSPSVYNAGSSGGYLFNGNHVEKIIAGHLDDIAISADGCKAVFVHKATLKDSFTTTPESKEKPRKHSLKMINFCNAGSSK